MTANLLSMGAVDFGIIIDGAVVMVEGLFVALDSKAREVGMEKFNKLAKLSLFKIPGQKWAKPFSFQSSLLSLVLSPSSLSKKSKAKCFPPLAWTLAFALPQGAAAHTYIRTSTQQHPVKKKCSGRNTTRWYRSSRTA